MARHPSERSGSAPCVSNVPPAPEPLSASPRDGLSSGREDARCYLVNIVRLLAGIALSPESEAAPHTKMMAAKELVTIANLAPQATPAPPQLLDEDADGGSYDEGGPPS